MIAGVWFDELDCFDPEPPRLIHEINPVNILKQFLAAQQMDRLITHIVESRDKRNYQAVITTTALPGSVHDVVDYDLELSGYTTWKLRHPLHMSLLDTVAWPSLALGLDGTTPPKS